MAFEAVMNLISGKPPVAPPGDNFSLPLTASEDAVAGSVYRLNRVGSGNFRLTLATAAVKTAAVVCMEDADGVADDNSTPQVNVRVAWITPGTVFKVPITNKAGTGDPTTLHADVRIGGTCNINDKGDGLDGQTDTSAVDGPLSIVKLDRDEHLAWVVFNAGYLSQDRS